MILALVFVAIILQVVAVRNTQGDLGTALSTDVPGFLPWLAAIVAVGSLGYAPVFQRPARMLLGLIVLVIFLKNSSGIISSIKNLGQAVQSDPSAVTPAQQSSKSASAQGVNWTGTQTVSSTSQQLLAMAEQLSVPLALSMAG